MKKNFLITLIIILLLAMSVPVYGIDSMEFKKDFTTRYPGEEICINIKLLNDYHNYDGNLEAFDMHIKYDLDVFENIEIIKGEMCSDEFQWSVDNGNIYIGDYNISELNQGESIFTLKAVVKSRAAIGNTMIEIVEANLYSGDKVEKVSCGIQQSIIEIGSYSDNQLAKIRNLDYLFSIYKSSSEEDKGAMCKVIYKELINCDKMGIGRNSISNLEEIEKALGEHLVSKFKIVIKAEYAKDDMKNIVLIINNETTNFGTYEFKNGAIYIEGRFNEPILSDDFINMELYTDKGLYKGKVSVEMIKGANWFDTVADYKDINVKYGDINNDHNIDLNDAIYMKTRLGRKDVSNYDLDGDGIITIKDLYHVRKNIELKSNTNGGN